MGFLRKYEYKIMPIVPDDKWIGAKPTTKNASLERVFRDKKGHIPRYGNPGMTQNQGF